MNNGSKNLMRTVGLLVASLIVLLCNSHQVRAQENIDTRNIRSKSVPASPGERETTTPHDGPRYTLDEKGRIIEEGNGEGLTINYRYDDRGNLVKWQDTMGGGQEITYNDAGFPVAVKNVLGEVRHYEYDQQGNLKKYTDANGRSKTFTYAKNGMVEGVIDAAGEGARYVYDDEGRIVEQYSPSGSVVKYSYDQASRLQSVSDSLGRTHLYTYDNSGRLIQYTDAKGQRTRYSYDDSGRLIGKTNGDGKTIRYTYDSNSNIKRIDDGSFPVRYVYDRKGHITAIDYPAITKSLKYLYTDNGLLEQFIDSEGHSITYTYDHKNRLVAQQSSSGERYSFAYDARGRLIAIAYPNGFSRRYQYDALGRTAAITYTDKNGREIKAWQYSYDRNSNPVSISDRDGQTILYTYDRVNRLLTADTGKSVQSYGYFPGGNRKYFKKGTRVLTYQYDKADQLLSAGDETFVHDANGNLIARRTARGVTRYSYDADNKLTAVTGPDRKTVRFGYSPAGERIWREDGGGRSYFITDGTHVLAELDQNKHVRKRYIYGPGIDFPLAVRQGENIYHYVSDRFHTTAALMDDQGQEAVSYSIDSWGNVTQELGELGNRILFTGREYEFEIGLYYYRARYYDPGLGRFLIPDPHEPTLTIPQSLNRYLYVRNAPTRYTDPMGLNPDIQMSAPVEDIDIDLSIIYPGLKGSVPKPPDGQPVPRYPIWESTGQPAIGPLPSSAPATPPPVQNPDPTPRVAGPLPTNTPAGPRGPAKIIAPPPIKRAPIPVVGGPKTMAPPPVKQPVTGPREEPVITSAPPIRRGPIPLPGQPRIIPRPPIKGPGFFDISKGLDRAVKIEKSPLKSGVNTAAVLLRLANELMYCKERYKGQAYIDCVSGILSPSMGYSMVTALPIAILLPKAAVVMTIVGGVVAWYEVTDESWKLICTYELEDIAERATDSMLDNMIEKDNNGVSKLDHIIGSITDDISRLEVEAGQIKGLEQKLVEMGNKCDEKEKAAEKVRKEIEQKLAELRQLIKQCQQSATGKNRNIAQQKAEKLVQEIENLSDKLISQANEQQDELKMAEAILMDLRSQDINCEGIGPSMNIPRRTRFDCDRAYTRGRIKSFLNTLSKLIEGTSAKRMAFSSYEIDRRAKDFSKRVAAYVRVYDDLEKLQKQFENFDKVQFETWETVHSRVILIRDLASETVIKSEKALKMLDEARELLKLCGKTLGLELTKSARATEVLKDEEVLYYYTVENTGNEPLVSISIQDNKCAPITAAKTDKELDPGEIWQYECTAALKNTTTNTAQATGTDQGGDRTRSNRATLTVKVIDDKVRVPYLLGLSKSAAAYDLEEAGLKANGLDDYGPLPKDQVFRQSPEPETVVPKNSTVSFWISNGPAPEVRTLYLDPPLQTIAIDGRAFIKAVLVYEDNSEKDVTREAVWSMSPENIARIDGPGSFTGVAEGRAIIKARFDGNAGLSSLTVEEDWSTRWEDPISHADDLTARALPPPPDAFTWYVLCNKSSGDVVYGEDTNPTKFDILAGPLQGPRAAKQWIDQNIPSWRCDTAAGTTGEWNVLCNKQNHSVGIGKSNDASRFFIMARGFTSEQTARGWVTQSCPSWMCSEGGGCAKGPRGGGDWAVVCSKEHGGIGLTRRPDPTRFWIFTDGLLGEKDARMWVDQRCPSWRCNRNGVCIPGVRVKRDKPLELPPDFGRIKKPHALPQDSGSEDSGHETGQEAGNGNGSWPSTTATTQAEVENTSRQEFSATCIFKSKTKANLEIGRRTINASSQQELDAMVRRHCTTNDFEVSVQQKGAAAKVHKATCIFISKTKANLEIGRRTITASSRQELDALIHQQCTTDTFYVKVQIE